MKLSYKNIYYFKYSNKNCILKPSIRCLTRSFYFFKMINFFKKNNFIQKFILKIFLNNYYYLWLIFIQTNDFYYYYLLIKKIIERSLYVSSHNYLWIISFNYIHASNVFLNFNISYSTKIKNFKKINKSFIKKINSDIKKKSFNSVTYLKDKKNYFTLHFIRTQRRYNKRRYSKVRAVSRPSFFAGILLSSIMLGVLWNATIKSVDWLTTWIITIDVNFILFIFFFYYIFRLYRLYYITIFVRKRGRVKIISKINLLLTNFLIKYIFK